MQCLTDSSPPNEFNTIGFQMSCATSSYFRPIAPERTVFQRMPFTTVLPKARRLASRKRLRNIDTHVCRSPRDRCLPGDSSSASRFELSQDSISTLVSKLDHVSRHMQAALSSPEKQSQVIWYKM
jgi:hypothetical protein